MYTDAFFYCMATASMWDSTSIWDSTKVLPVCLYIEIGRPEKDRYVFGKDFNFSSWIAEKIETFINHFLE